MFTPPTQTIGPIPAHSKICLNHNTRAERTLCLSLKRAPQIHVIHSVTHPQFPADLYSSEISCPRTLRHADGEEWDLNRQPSCWRTTTLPLGPTPLIRMIEKSKATGPNIETYRPSLLLSEQDTQTHC
ncbi:unnamed protein product [Pleuronectes platessa]|uniref:Uncharacterized protein n=1 Tax=Pleuronectes platessa TaxID=8262 RepID=A0A9N7W0I5_PLEPL|nr:unnamed protein product [Pleuronectes platessa]